jgi:hypothetical protein
MMNFGQHDTILFLETNFTYLTYMDGILRDTRDVLNLYFYARVYI